jgi:hypothetical protein
MIKANIIDLTKLTCGVWETSGYRGVAATQDCQPLTSASRQFGVWQVLPASKK